MRVFLAVMGILPILLLVFAAMVPGNLRRSSRVRELESEAGQLRSQLRGAAPASDTSAEES